MKTYRGHVTKEDGTHVARDLQVALDERQDPWWGVIIIPYGIHNFSVDSHKLELSDGRSGKILITDLGAGGNRPTSVRFKGGGAGLS